MQLMTRQMILTAMHDGRLGIVPFSEIHLQHASYYFTLDETYRLPDDSGEEPILRALTDASPFLSLSPGGYYHVRSREQIRLGLDIVGIIGARSRMAWGNLELVNAPFIDPGFPSPGGGGHLELGLKFHGLMRGAIRAGSIIGKITFWDISESDVQAPPEDSMTGERFREIVERGFGADEI